MLRRPHLHLSASLASLVLLTAPTQHSQESVRFLRGENDLNRSMESSTANGQSFLHYTAAGEPLIARISRFASPDGGVTIDPASEQILLAIEQQTLLHHDDGIASAAGPSARRRRSPSPRPATPPARAPMPCGSCR